MKEIKFSYTRERMFPGYDGKFCKVCPQITYDGEKTAFLTYQMLLLTGSDVFYDTYIAKSTDGGKTFGEPRKRKNMQWFEDGIRMAPFGWLLYNKHHKRWFGLGQINKYANDDEPIVINEIGVTEPMQFSFDADEGDWSEVRKLDFPFDAVSAVPMPQIVEYDNGDILVPFYYTTEDNNYAAIITVRYAFDGEWFQMVDYGTPIMGNSFENRGLLEPALTELNGKFYLTLRSDYMGVFAVSDDGFNFSEPREWKWDNGEELGNYNTMQKWIRNKDGLFLTYTRRGAHNDHVFRHRAPIFMARFDEENMCLVRSSEVILVPELGTRLGNFTITETMDNEAWLVTAEWMQPAGCEKYGSDNSIWRASVIWE